MVNFIVNKFESFFFSNRNLNFEVGDDDLRVKNLGKKTFEEKLELLDRLNQCKQPGFIKKLYFSCLLHKKIVNFNAKIKFFAQTSVEHLSHFKAFQGAKNKNVIPMIKKAIAFDSFFKTKMDVILEHDIFVKAKKLRLHLEKLISEKKATTSDSQSKKSIETTTAIKPKKNVNVIFTQLLVKQITVQSEAGCIGKKWAIPVSLGAKGSSHAIILQLIKTDNDRLALRVFNSGYGASFHAQSEKDAHKFQSFIEITDISLKSFLVFYGIVTYLEFINASTKREPSREGLKGFYALLHTLDGKLSNPLPNTQGHAFTKGQIGGSCVSTSIMAYLKYNMDKKEHKLFKRNLRLNSLLSIYKMMKWGQTTRVNQVVCLGIIEKLKKNFVNSNEKIPESIIACEKELIKIKMKKTLKQVLNSKIRARKEKNDARKIFRAYSLKKGTFDDLLLRRSEISRMTKDEFREFFTFLQTVEIKAEYNTEYKKYFQIAKYMACFFKENFNDVESYNDYVGHLSSLILEKLKVLQNNWVSEIGEKIKEIKMMSVEDLLELKKKNAMVGRNLLSVKELNIFQRFIRYHEETAEKSEQLLNSADHVQSKKFKQLKLQFKLKEILKDEWPQISPEVYKEIFVDLGIDKEVTLEDFTKEVKEVNVADFTFN